MGKIDTKSHGNVEQKDAIDLTGKILISMPSFDETDVFRKAIIYICEHNEFGAMGIIVNREIDTVNFSDLLDNMKIKSPTSDKAPPIFFGGPVDIEKGMVLHPIEEFESEGTVQITDHLALTGTIDIVKKLAAGLGPAKNVFALGYSGWGENQLEEEIKNNTWLIVDSDDDLLFHLDPKDKWEKALNKLGIDASALTGFSGHS